MKRLLLVVALLLGSVATISAQHPSQRLEDVIYLKSGNVLRGIIIEQVPAVSYVIATIDGMTYTIDALSIEKITVEPAITREQTTNAHLCYINPFVPHIHDADGNLIFPLSPGGAFFRSLFLPGLGQMGNGEEVKGVLLLSGALLGVLGVTVGTNAVPNKYVDLVGYGGAALAAGCYLYSLIDAPIYAYKWNKKYGFKKNGYNYMRVGPAVGVAGGNAALGVNVAIGF